MLKRLAGPFPLTLNGEPATLQTEEFVTWHDDLCLITNILDGVSYGCLVQLDGVAHVRNVSGVPGYVRHNLRTGGLCVFSSDFYPGLDMRTLRAIDADVLTAAAGGNFWTVLPDGRYIYANGGDVFTLDGTSPALEATLDADSGHAGSLGTITPASASRVFCAFTDGRGYFYDWVAKTVVSWTRRVPACVCWFYSRRFDVFVVVTEDTGVQYLSVYAHEVDPADLSDPVAETAASPGLVVPCAVRLLGAEGEPCEGFPVAWSSDVEAVTRDQSVTDADGYARTGLRIDPDSEATEVEISAAVVV